MTQSYTIEDISGWTQRPALTQSQLTADTRADVVVIGGGLTGLSTALSLRANGADVALIEKDFCGYGASGRNAGHLNGSIGKDVPSLVKQCGEERARHLLRFARASVEYAEHLMRERHIDCEYEANGNISAGLLAQHQEPLEHAARVGREYGCAMQWLSPAEMRERALPPAFRCGVLHERGGVLHPGKLMDGLRRAAIELGVRVYEDTPLTHLEDGSPLVAHTPNGSVTANAAVLATNAYTPDTGRQTRKLVPLRVSQFETQPLTPEQLDVVGWHGREGLSTTHQILESFRLTSRNTIIGGSKTVSYAFGSQRKRNNEQRALSTLEEAFHERFPMLWDVSFDRCWSGWIGLPLDFLPILGTEGSHRNVHYGMAYAGHGVAHATLMGSILAEASQGREHELAAGFDRRVFNWPVEPFRWVAAKAISGVLGAVDRRTDRKIRAVQETAARQSPTPAATAPKPRTT